ncbi:stressosome-associated protein Prli42 [Caldalkalibacillus salinus]
MLPKKLVKTVVYIIIGSLVLSSLVMGAGFFL